MTEGALLSYERYQPWKRVIEAGFWIAVTGVNCVANSITTLMELRRGDSSIQAWEPAVWETSSAVMWLLVVLPAMAWFTRRYPFQWGDWRRQLAVMPGPASSSASCTWWAWWGCGCSPIGPRA